MVQNIEWGEITFTKENIYVIVDISSIDPA